MHSAGIRDTDTEQALQEHLNRGVNPGMGGELLRCLLRTYDRIAFGGGF